MNVVIPLVVLLVVVIVYMVRPLPPLIYTSLPLAEAGARERANATGRRQVVWKVRSFDRFIIRDYGEPAPDGTLRIPAYTASPRGLPSDPEWRAFLDRWDHERAVARIGKSLEPTRRKRAKLN